MNNRISRIFAIAVLILSILPAVLFVKQFSTAMPLTDEWEFLRGVIAVEEIDFTSFRDLGKIIEQIPFKFNEHIVIVPFLLYWPISEISNFDNRFLIGLILMAWVTLLLIFRFTIIKSTSWTLPISLILFSPARYVEFLWGFEFTLALSIVLPILGLVVLSRIKADDGGTPRQLTKALQSISLIMVGTLSSAGGFFGFGAAAVLLMFHRLSFRSTVILLTLLFGISLVVYGALMLGSAPEFRIRVLYILTAFGATILGMPVSLSSFGLDALSMTGLTIFILMLASIFIAARHGILSFLALPIGIFVFGVFAISAIAMGREYLANWHLMYAMPSVCSVYAASYINYREVRSPLAKTTLVAITLVLMLALIAYYNSFFKYGPSYHAYIRSVEQYARTYLDKPSQKKPFPDIPFYASIPLFLAARNHPVFADENRIILNSERIQIAEAKLFVEPYKAPGSSHSHKRVVAVLPWDTKADAAILSIAQSDVILRKTDPYTLRRTARLEALKGKCFSGWIPAKSVTMDTLKGSVSIVRLNK